MARTLAMYTDTSVCIGCRACEVACKQWNQLDAEEPLWTGSYQTQTHFTDKTWRHVKFVEKQTEANEVKWLLMSDVCKHCNQAGCLEACPTGALYRTAFGTVDINQNICNGCRYCVTACPFGVVHFNEGTGRVNKCTFCVDRTSEGMQTACAKTCPTQSIQFGYRDELVAKAKKRLADLHAQGVKEANLYGADEDGFLGGLNAFFLLLDKPEAYGLPENPQLPQKPIFADAGLSAGTAVLAGLGAVIAFRQRGNDGEKEE
jgi:formate dehydrogenase iron-sulfur subunit